MTIKLIGAGFGRTGTMSIKAALEELGFDKCYHMVDIIKEPSLAQGWYEASQGKSVQWDKIFEGYLATVDWPGCSFYRELMDQYPDAKVLLTIRDPETWYDSMSSTIYQLRNGTLGWLTPFVPSFNVIPKMQQNVIWGGTFNNRFEDRQYAIKVFNDHIAEVKRVVPPERLLVYHVKEGWEPLCRFLDVPIPQTPFPHMNSRAELQRIIAMRNVVTEWIPALILAVLIYFVGSRFGDE